MQESFFSEAEIAEMSSGVIPPPPTDYVLPTKFPDLSKAARIAWDWETKDPNLPKRGNGVYRKDGFIVGGSIAAWDKSGQLMHAEYYPMRHRSGPNLEPENVLQYFRDQLNFYEGEIAGANLLYEGDWGQSVGITPVFAKWRDVQWAEALIDEMAFDYRLETIAQKYLGHGKFKNHFAGLYGPDYIARFDEVHPGHARMYGVTDVLLPNAVLKHQYKELNSLGLMDLFTIESRLTPFLLYLRRQGVRIDRAKAQQNHDMLVGKRDAALKQLASVTGVEFNASNFGDKKMLEYVFEKKLGIKVPRTKAKKDGKGGGEPSITDQWLINLCECKKEIKGKKIDDLFCGHPGRLLALANKYEKAFTVFVDSYIFDHAVGDRIHAEFHPLRRADDDTEAGTESGRFSGGHPNLQNIPARDKEIGPLCRGMFIPEDGADWWSKDYSQIEYRYLIHMASIMPELKGTNEAAVRRKKSLEKVWEVIELYKSQPKTDFHQALADLVTKVLGKEFPRSDAKNLNFGLVYGMGLQHLADTLNMLDEKGKPNDKVKPLMDTYHGAAPFVKDLYDLCINNAATTGEIRTILNRRSQFEFYQPKFREKGKSYGELPFIQAINEWGFIELERCQTHKALNRLLQGSAADCMKMAMVKAWEAGVFSSRTDLTCSLTVHDELDGSVFPTKRGKEALDELENIMATAIPLNVPVLVGSGGGKSWAEAK